MRWLQLGGRFGSRKSPGGRDGPSVSNDEPGVVPNVVEDGVNPLHATVHHDALHGVFVNAAAHGVDAVRAHATMHSASAHGQRA